MEEQRILAEIEQEFARSEPVLAARLATFGRAGRVGRAVLRRSAQAERRSARILVLASLTALLLLTVMSAPR
jgi:hypothetical protein